MDARAGRDRLRPGGLAAPKSSSERRGLFGLRQEARWATARARGLAAVRRWALRADAVVGRRVLGRDAAVLDHTTQASAFVTDQMLVDLQQRLPASIAIALQRAGALSAPSSRRFLRVRSQSLAPELAVIPADRVRAFRSSRLSLRCTLMVTPHDRGKGHRRIPRRSANQITREFMLSTDFKPPPRHRGDRAIRPAAAGEQGTDRPDARSQAETYLGCLFDAAPPETFIELRWRV